MSKSWQLALPRWAIELRDGPVSKSKTVHVPDPPGFVALHGKKSSSSKHAATETAASLSSEETDSLKLKKAWEQAIAPAKALPMNAIGMYMTGNSLQVFSIMMVFMLFKTPVQALFNISNVFTRFETDRTRQKMLAVKLTYIVTNLLALALGMYKVNAMGLLPTTRSDWLAWESAREPLELAVPLGSL